MFSQQNGKDKDSNFFLQARTQGEGGGGAPPPDKKVRSVRSDTAR